MGRGGMVLVQGGVGWGRDRGEMLGGRNNYVSVGLAAIVPIRRKALHFIACLGILHSLRLYLRGFSAER
jgi:hypothetical protein